MSELDLHSELAKVHRRLDQFEHLLNQHQHRQKKLDAAYEEARQFQQEIRALGDSLKTAPRGQTKVPAAVETQLKGLETRVLFLEEKVG